MKRAKRGTAGSKGDWITPASLGLVLPSDPTIDANARPLWRGVEVELDLDLDEAIDRTWAAGTPAQYIAHHWLHETAAGLSTLS